MAGVNTKSQGVWIVGALLLLVGYRALPSGKAGGDKAPAVTDAATLALATPTRPSGALTASAAPARPNPGEPGAAEAPAVAVASVCEHRVRAVLADYAAAHWATPYQNWQTLIALVPDPIDSGMTYYFDAVLEGIESAAADSAARRVRDRFWLPWRDLEAATADNAEIRACRTDYPGILLYRPTEPQERPLAVFLVGETSTWGLQERAFGRALLLADELARKSELASAEARILGPTFSGSAYSLRTALERWLTPNATPAPGGPAPDQALLQAFEVRSGTATNPSLKGMLEADLGGVVRYETSIANDTELRCALFRQLRENLRLPCERHGKEPSCRLTGVALLSEGSTFYGTSFEQSSKQAEQALPGRDCPLPELDYSFPNVVSVRSAYQGGSRDAHDAFSISRLLLDTTGPSDPLPRIHPSLSAWTPVAQDIALADVLTELSGNDIRYVGIVATDVNDSTFLAERVKRQLPDVRLLTFGSDILYAHPRYAPVLNGMLIAHSRPNLGGANAALQTDRINVRRREMIDGVYEAALSLLTAGPATLPTRATARVSVLNNGKFWITDPRESAAGNVRVPRVWKVLIIYLGLFGCFNGAVYLGQTTWRKRRTRGALLPLRALRPCTRPDLRADHDVRVLALFLIIAAPLLLALRIEWRVLDLGSLSTWPLLAGAVIASAAWLLALTRALGSVLGVSAGKKPSVAKAHLLLLGACTVPIGVGIWHWGAACPLIRGMSLASGVSPLAPVMLGATLGYIALFGGLIRLHLLDELRQGNAVEGIAEMAGPLTETLGKTAQSGFGKLEKELIQGLHSPWLAAGKAVLFLYCFLFCGFALLFVLKPVTTLELRSWHWLLVASVVGSAAMLAGVYVHLWVYWLKLRGVLRCLAFHPISKALSSIPNALRRGAESQLLWAGSSVVELTEAVNLLGQLAAARGRFNADDFLAFPARATLEAERARAAQYLENELCGISIRPPAAGSTSTTPVTTTAELLLSLLLDQARQFSQTLSPLWQHALETRSPSALVPKAELKTADGTPTTPATESPGRTPATSTPAAPASGEASGQADAEGSGKRPRTLDVYAGDLSSGTRAWLGTVESYLGTLVALFVVRYVRQFRYFVLVLVSCSVLLVLLTSLYAFQPQRLMLSVEFVATAAIVGTALGMFFALDRDVIISEIAGTKAGEVTINSTLATRVVTWGILPLASVLAAQYPEFTQWLLAAAEPFAHALR